MGGQHALSSELPAPGGGVDPSTLDRFFSYSDGIAGGVDFDTGVSVPIKPPDTNQEVTGTALTYDDTTGVITVGEAGLYCFHASVQLLDDSLLESDSVSLSIFAGDFSFRERKTWASNGVTGEWPLQVTTPVMFVPAATTVDAVLFVRPDGANGTRKLNTMVLLAQRIA